VAADTGPVVSWPLCGVELWPPLVVGVVVVVVGVVEACILEELPAIWFMIASAEAIGIRSSV
jgi:hypothetical protein